ncbi:CARDB domain-containing protein [Natronobiforma cellulositropha]|uniref:CARDB domain-containing protein n=1 Tax=Natronobiforma cellulositropha TaxID=1679076 RepID=UPI0021D5A280|nr:CARDB domain-containing protein [Natronobiforma cellulositropha]
MIRTTRYLHSARPFGRWPVLCLCLVLAIGVLAVGGLALSTSGEPAAPLEESLGPNLLENGDCRDFDSGSIHPDGWVQVSTSGTGVQCLEEEEWSPPPVSGDRVFHDNGESAESVVEQTVSGVEGGQEYQLSGWVGSDELTENDHARLEVRFLDGDGSEVGGALTLDGLQSDSHEAMEEFSDTTVAPAEATQAVVSIALVKAGDGLNFPLIYVDDVQLRQFSGPPTAFDVDAGEVGIEHTFEPEQTLFDDWGEGADDRGDEPAEVSHFGGGDLSSEVTDYAAGSTATLAGGELAVNADGSFSLVEPTETGEFAFEYRLAKADGVRSDDATVTITVRDHQLYNPQCEEADGNQQQKPVGWDRAEGTIQCLDLESDPVTEHTSVGSASFADFQSSEAFARLEQTVYVVPGRTYTFTGLYGTDDVDDYGTVTVDFLDEDGAVLTEGAIERTDLQSESTTDFDRFTEASEAPADARQAVIGLEIESVESYPDEPAGVYFDDLEFEPGDPADEPVVAYDVDGLEVGLEHTLAPSDSLLADWGNGADELGEPEAEVIGFGGGDLGGDAGAHAPGANTTLAGGELTVNADGTFSLVEPTETGTYTFAYRLENEYHTDEATVEIWVRDSSLLNPACEEQFEEGWSDVSPGDGHIGCLDPQESSVGGTMEPAVGDAVLGDVAGTGDDAVAEQTVPIRPGYTYELRALVGTETVPEDSAVSLAVEFLDGDGEVLPDEGLEREGLRSADASFEPVEETTVAPESATHATVRVTITNGAESGYAGAYADDLTFDALGTPPTAMAVDGLDLAIGATLETSVFDDHGHGADDRGEPPAAVAGFGGGDLGGDVTSHDAGTNTPLAGGNVSIDADGTLSVDAPTEDGTYSVEYRLENEAGADEATVTITVEDRSEFAVSIEETPETVVEGEPLNVSAGVENVGENEGTQTVTLEARYENETVAFTDDHEVSLGVGENESLEASWVPTAAENYTVAVSSEDDQASTTVRVLEPAAFAVSIEDTNSPIAANETLLVNATISNTGEVDGTQTVELEVNDSVRDFQEVALEGGANETVSLAWETGVGDIGNHTVSVSSDDGQNETDVRVLEPANFTVSIDETNSPVVANESLVVNATISNEGEAEVTQTIELTANDSVRDSGPMTLEGGANETVSLEWETGESDAGNYTVTVSSDDDQNETDVRVLEPANFAITIDGTNSPVVANETLLVNATVSNTGEVDGTQTVELEINDSVTDSEDVTLEGGANETITLEWGTGEGDAGSYNLTVSSPDDQDTAAVRVLEPANFSVSIDETNSPVLVNETVIVNATVSNTGEVNGTQTIELEVNDSVRDSTTLTLEGGANQTVTLEWQTGETDAGNHTVTVSSEDDERNATVTVVPFVTVEGTVSESATGEPLENATVELETATETYTTATNASGVFAIDAVPGTGENATVNVSARAFDPASLETTVTETGATTDVDLERTAHFFGVEGVDGPDEVEADEPFSITAAVANLGASDWTDTVNATAGGELLATENVSLEAGANTTVELEGALAETGVVDVVVATANESESHTLEVVSAPGPGGSSGSSGSSATPADIVIESTTLSESETGVGEAVTVDVTLTNAGERDGSTDLALTVDGEHVDSTLVNVGGGETVTESFTLTVDQAGVYELAVSGFDVGTLSVGEVDTAPFTYTVTAEPETPVAGDDVVIRLDVETLPGEERDATVTVEFDGTIILDEDRRLEGGATTSIVAQTGPLEAGEYSWIAIVDERVETGTLTVAPDEAADGEPADESDDGTGGADDIPGFGAGVALLVLTAVAVLAARRRR